MLMDAGLDTGPIVAVEQRVALDGHGEGPCARGAASRPLGSRPARPTRSPGWLNGSVRAVPSVRKLDRRADAPPPVREDGRLDPARPAAEPLERARSAPTPPWPGTFLEIGGERLVVDTASVAPSQPGDAVGAIVAKADTPRSPPSTAASSC